MRLSDDQFHAIVGRDFRLGEFKDDRRSADRIPLQQRAIMAPIQPDGAVGAQVACLVKEVSSTGVGVVFVSQVKKGSEFVLWLKDKKGETLVVECKVIRCTAGGQGSRLFTVGASLERLHVPLSPEQRRKQMEIEQIRAAILG